MPRQQDGIGRRALRLILLPALTLAAAPVLAAERNYSVTSFDRIRVEGPFEVVVSTGRAVSAKASGSEQALERLSLQVEGRTLRIRPNVSGWGGFPGKQSPPARIAVTTPELGTAALAGSGRLDVDHMRGARLILTVEGSGRIAVGSIDADNASLAIAGSGQIEVAGQARQAAAVARGVAEIRAPDLMVSDLTLTSESAGSVVMHAERSAKVTGMGVGAITVGGGAACEVRHVGSGPISCGKGSDQSQRR